MLFPETLKQVRPYARQSKEVLHSERWKTANFADLARVAGQLDREKAAGCDLIVRECFLTAAHFGSWTRNTLTLLCLQALSKEPEAIKLPEDAVEKAQHLKAAWERQSGLELARGMSFLSVMAFALVSYAHATAAIQSGTFVPSLAAPSLKALDAAICRQKQRKELSRRNLRMIVGALERLKSLHEGLLALSGSVDERAGGIISG